MKKSHVLVLVAGSLAVASVVAERFTTMPVKQRPLVGVVKAVPAVDPWNTLSTAIKNKNNAQFEHSLNQLGNALVHSGNKVKLNQARQLALQHQNTYAFNRLNAEVVKRSTKAVTSAIRNIKLF